MLTLHLMLISFSSQNCEYCATETTAVNPPKPFFWLMLRNTQTHAVWLLEWWKTDTIMDTAVRASDTLQATIPPHTCCYSCTRKRWLGWNNVTSYNEHTDGRCWPAHRSFSSDPKYKSLKSTTAGAMRTAVKQYRCCNCNTLRQLQHDHQHQWTTILDQTEVEYVTGCRNSGQHDNCSVHPSMAHLAQTD